MGIKNRLNELLQERKMNANELASAINVTPSTIYSMLQRDSARIDIDLIMKISHALGVTADELLSEEIAAAAVEAPLDSTKAKLLKMYDSLNQEGRMKLLEYAALLNDSGNFKEAKAGNKFA